MNHPLSDMMMSSMGKIRDMIDVNTVIGEPIAAGDVTIIPVTKVSIGYGAGGSDFATKNYPANRDNAFGGGAGAGEPIPFEEAFDQLRHCYMENERTNRVRHESGYQRVVQITIIGRGAGTFTIRFNENGMQVEPTSASDAEAYVHCSFDNLLAMARGFVTVDKLYLSGQLRLSGNLSKGFEIRYLLSPAKQRA